MHNLTGTMWRVVAARSFDKEGHDLLPFGPHPIGFAIFEAVRMLVAIGDGRALLPANGPPRRFVSYTGAYRFDGVELATSPDDASRPEHMVQQVRHLRFESETRMVAVLISGLPELRGSEVVWERVGVVVPTLQEGETTEKGRLHPTRGPLNEGLPPPEGHARGDTLSLAGVLTMRAA
jgi:hypothetical protein